MNGDLTASRMTIPVSIVVPTFNRAGMISRALNSILQQAVPADEIIVVDDGSNDDTETVLRPYRDRIVYLQTQHGGAGHARNAGLKAARNQLIAFLDSDDEWMPWRLQLGRSLLQKRSDILFCFSDLGYRDSGGQQQRRAMTLPHPGPKVSDILQSKILFSSVADLPSGLSDFPVYLGNLYPGQMQREFVQVNTLLYRRPADHSHDVVFPEDLRTREDWEFVGRLARQGAAAYLDCETVWLYRHEGPQLTKLDRLIYFEDRLKLLERVWGTDAAFLREFGNEYEKVHDDTFWLLMREYLCRGRRAEVQAQIAKRSTVPIQFRLLSHQPSAINRWAFRLRDILVGWRS